MLSSVILALVCLAYFLVAISWIFAVLLMKGGSPIWVLAANANLSDSTKRCTLSPVWPSSAKSSYVSSVLSRASRTGPPHGAGTV